MFLDVVMVAFLLFLRFRVFLAGRYLSKFELSSLFTPKIDEWRSLAAIVSKTFTSSFYRFLSKSMVTY